MNKLELYNIRGGKRLRRGYTTGSCAAAAAKGAALHLLTGAAPEEIALDTPAGVALELSPEWLRREGESALCAVRKDAGDDPDVTDGLLVVAAVTRVPEGFLVDGGEGVGRVTREGLRCPVGEAAINPVPRRMITGALEEAAQMAGYHGGLRAVISVPGGEAVAARTFNARLGIVGGISILGTSGIVEPMSEAALVDTIKTEIDVRRAAGETRLLIAPGNYGREFARERYGLCLEEAVKCSNFIGETLDYAVYRGFARLVLAGHAGKLVKLAAGIMQTHSSVADGRMEILACHCALQGLSREQVEQVFGCVTVDEADGLLRSWGADRRVWSSVAGRVDFHLRARVGHRAEVAFAAFCESGVVMESGISGLL